MKTNTISISRMGLLYRNYWILNGKNTLFVLGGIIVAIILSHLYVSLNYYNKSEPSFSSAFHRQYFTLTFVLAALLWNGHAFPGLRSKEKAFDYLCLPASNIEKFIFEFINRVVLFIILFPINYWVFTNLVAWSFHVYNPYYVNYGFQLSYVFSEWSSLDLTLAASIGFLLFSLSFTGATFFQKLPLAKTILAVFLIISFYAGYTYFVVEVLGLKEYNPAKNSILFMRNGEEAKLAATVAAVFINITLLAISYFKIKEKEA